MLVERINQHPILIPELAARTWKEDVDLGGYAGGSPDGDVAVAIVGLNDVRTNGLEVVTSEPGRASTCRSSELTKGEAAERSWSGTLAIKCA